MAGQIVDATLVKARIKAGEKAAENWPDKPAKARQKGERPNATGSSDAANDARWTMKYSNAKPAADGKPQIDIAIPAFGYKSHTFPSTAATASSVGPRSPTPRPMTGRGCAWG